MRYLIILLLFFLQACSVAPANSQGISPKYAIPVTLVIDYPIDKKKAIRKFLTAVIEVKNRTGIVFYPGLVFVTQAGDDFGSGYAFLAESKGFVFTIRYRKNNRKQGEAAPPPNPKAKDKKYLCALAQKYGVADATWHKNTSYTIAHELYHWLGATHTFGGVMMPIHVDGLTRTYELRKENVAEIDKCLAASFAK